VVYGILRRRLMMDFIIDHFLENPRLRDNDQLRRILLLGLYQLLYMDKVPEHAAVHETVECARRGRETRQVAGVVNGLLRNVIRAKGRLPRPDENVPLVKRLSITYSHPEWLVERWLGLYGLSHVRKLLEFNNRVPDMFLRRRVHGISRQQFESAVRPICEPVGGYAGLYYRLIRTMPIEGIAMFREGQCTVQAPSSGWVVALMEVRRADTVLDVCSAPGGKTTLIAEMIGDRGAVCACEVRMYRMRRVAEAVMRLRLRKVYLVLANGTRLPFAGLFDKVLLDAPCSGTGVMHRHPDARWIRTPEQISHAAESQRRLLDQAAEAVVPGGCLVYSTCSLEPEENERQVEAFLERHPAYTLERPPSSVPQTYVDNAGYLRITPFEHNMDGIFAARLRRGA
ncbi:MAG: 16S rRNA (cytosine(967)-C(5))-methyltransferase RsmB, partial [Chitinivibrionales bacterium]|nr:16S rRNA (cytosine(967)-C(5))-methyltransferase RsmB [Chitinivibrionales bacterium]MBD3358267.1 16S rRNA (cytosine(967)-C(5))-methyltransferase RsmB [Chitinivibrionales bacterium]